MSESWNIYTYTNAVSNSVMLCLYLWHYYYIVFKIQHKIYITLKKELPCQTMGYVISPFSNLASVSVVSRRTRRRPKNRDSIPCRSRLFRPQRPDQVCCARQLPSKDFPLGLNRQGFEADVQLYVMPRWRMHGYIYIYFALFVFVSWLFITGTNVAFAFI